jgi:hypothetical protein
MTADLREYLARAQRLGNVITRGREVHLLEGPDRSEGGGLADGRLEDWATSLREGKPPGDGIDLERWTRGLKA